MKKLIKVLLSLVGATIIIGAVVFILQNKLLNSSKQEKQENQEEKMTINRLGQSFDTKTGKYIIEKDYSVYYIPKEDFYGIKIEIPEDIGKYGKYNTKDVYSPAPIIDEYDGSFNGYKLNLSDITSAYLFIFGNYTRNLHILLLDKSGNLSELAIEFTPDGMSTELNKNVKSNIETVLYKLYTGGHGAIIIEKNGNEQYF